MANEPSETAARDAAENRAATLRGSLEDRPIPRLLHELFRKQVTGQLLIVDDCGDESRLYLRDGAPVHLERPNDIDRLDQVLIETGLVGQEVIRNLSATLQPGRRLGEVLIERGMVSAKALSDVLKVQMRRKLMRLFFPRKGQFAIYVESHSFGTGGEFGEMRVDPRCLLYQGIRSAYDENRLEAELAPVKTLAFRLLPTLSSSVLEAMGFGANDPTVKALGERMLGLADLPVPGAKRMDSLAVVLALLYTDLLETAPLAAARTAELPTRKPTTGPTPTVNVQRTVELPTQKPPAANTAPRTLEFVVQKPGTGPTPTVNANRTMELPTRKPPAASPAVPPAPPPRESSRLPDPPRGLRTTGTFAAVSLGNQPAAPAPSAGARPGGLTGAQPAVDFTRTPSSSIANGTLGGRISELYEKLGTLSHFALLGVTENAPLAELGAAYLKNVRLYHPDRLPALGLGHLTEKAARIVAQLNEAQAVLADPKRKAEYVAARARPAQGPIVDSGQSIVAAERSFQMGEVLLRKSDYAKAVDAFAEAMRANPLEPIYKAYWAWARWDNPGPHKDRLVRETLKILEDTLKERPKFPQGLYWIGMLHKHNGDLTSAASAFRAAIGQDKNLLDAERELRVIELRKTRTSAQPLPEKPSSASAARPKDGVLNKLLKR
jgi:curved DNA-binding protein CbpA